MNKIVLVGLLLVGMQATYAQKKKNTAVKTLPARDVFVADLLSKMTLEEKIGQLNLPTSGDITTGQANSSDIGAKIRKGHVGGLFNIKAVNKIREVQRIAVEESRLGIPLIFGMDVIHGYETTFPIPLGLSSIWDMDVIERTAQIAAQEATADGINWTFSPMLDISRDPRWGRVSEGNGEDPYLGGRIATAMIKGYQGNSLSANNTLLSCAKHFALYGAPEGGRDYNTVDMSRIRMYNEYFPPFKAAVEAGVGSFMASFNEVDGIPATANKWLMTDVLRKQWGFTGFVVSDYTGVSEMIDHGLGDLQTVSALALKAGVHMDMVSEGYLTTLAQSVKENKISEDQITEAARLILNAKYDLGLFHDPYRYCDAQRAKTEIYSAKHREEARAISAQSLVLLQNKGNILPLNPQAKIALIGPLAANKENMAGTWSVATKHGISVSVLEGLQAVAGKHAQIRYSKGSNLDDDPAFEERATLFGKTLNRDNRTKEALLAEAIEVAKASDVIVLAMGESAEMSGESSSRTQLGIPQAQKDVIDALQKLNKPMVLLLFTGRPLVLTEEVEQIPAILNVWFPGSEAGYAIADVVFGKVNPSGRLSMTFPRSVGQVPIYYNHKNTGRPLMNTEGQFEKFRSNYLDERNEPLFPFGYGLSYTQFTYGPVQLSSTKLANSGTLTATVQVTNTGAYDGYEVVQLYVRDKVGSVTRPLKELKGFQRIWLKKGASQPVEFKLTIDDLKFYNSDLDFVAEPGDFEIFIGPDSMTTNQAAFELLP